MKIVSAEFVCGAAEASQFPHEVLPEIAFAGRSNVGKSSLINSLLRRKGLARTSSTPGRTRQINFFRINRSFFFVDLPGYGYAKAPQALRASWGELIEKYLKDRKQLAHCVLIVDSRIGPTLSDLDRASWLQRHLLPFFIVSTKSDKLSSFELQKSIKHTQSFGLGVPVVACSAAKGTGFDKLWVLLEPHIRMTTSHS